MFEVQVVAPYVAPALALSEHKFLGHTIERARALRLALLRLPAFTLGRRVIGEAQLIIQRDRHARARCPCGVLIEGDHSHPSYCDRRVQRCNRIYFFPDAFLRCGDIM